TSLENLVTLVISYSFHFIVKIIFDSSLNSNKNLPMDVEDVIIIGSGPAAYGAALYTAGKKPLLFEGEYTEGIGPGGQLTTTTDVDNYPGFPSGTEGPELMDRMKEQALSHNIRIISRNVTEVVKTGEFFSIKDYEKTYISKSVIVATGASAKRLYVPGTHEGEFWQKGISACAVCDGAIFRKKIVAVIGGGDSAMEEVLYLSKIATTAYLIHRRNGFRAREDKLEKVRNTKNIKIITPAELVAAKGGDLLESIDLMDNETKEIFSLEVNGLFFGIGHIPNTSFLNGLVKLDENGYIVTDENMNTSIGGLFACGDVQDHYYRQAITAAASGTVAGLECLKYLDSFNK
ncbi:thioredoxin reductase (NADPH), partial [Pancytospora epiphaga]